MQTALNRDFVSVDDYLAGEETSEIKHDYIGGSVYAMAGAIKEHNLIALNIYTALRSRLRGGPCQAFTSDIKVRLELLGDDVFYYPDVMVGCDPRDKHRLYLQYPKILVEVSSESTERLDRREKRWAYQSIESLEEYLIVAQDHVEVTVFRRAKNWTAEILKLPDQDVMLNSIDLIMPVGSVYEGVVPD